MYNSKFITATVAKDEEKTFSEIINSIIEYYETKMKFQ